VGEKVGVKEDFVRKYGLSAMIIEEACDFPAVILLVVSALETGWGRRVVDNNLLGIKKLDLIPGHVIIQTKEYENGEMVKKEERFQSFQDPTQSMVCYVAKICKETRYKKAWKERHSPFVFFSEIADAGYATDPLYAWKLENILTHFPKNWERLIYEKEE
jgi:flagellar protein FlgJ